MRVCRVRTADHPDGPRLPTFHGLAQLKATSKQPLEALYVDDRSINLKAFSRSRRQEIGRLTSNFTQALSETIIFTEGQYVGFWRIPSDNQVSGDQEDCFGVGRK
ncbi:hypothetical protein MES4922_190402 [Mesorhizobium ventifaucium]|uniref:Uncharacterized protein n=1 Tax=Mesorhizobium ventifaucium TaxID=666020 RepID=A0ABN8JI35_9HYPH|nr:hypothetical protein MES4922_190402 [Mesorhizobium ventifaucium]